MWNWRFSSTSGAMFSTSERKRPATDTSASCGQGWNLRSGWGEGKGVGPSRVSHPKRRRKGFGEVRGAGAGRRRASARQSMAVLLMSAGKLRARMRNLSPTGEKHSTTCSSLRTLSRKYSQRFSGLSMAPVCLSSGRTALHMLSLSSCVMRSGMYPLLSRSLMYTRKRSLTICPSVMRNTMGMLLTPVLV